MNIFRQEKTNRMLGDDFIRSVFGAEFWEAPSGGLSAAVSLTQPVQALASAGATAFSGSAGFTQILQALAGLASNLTSSGSLAQPNQTLAAAGNTAHTASGGLAQLAGYDGANGYQTFLASLSAGQPVAIIASDGKQTYSGEITFDHGVATLTMEASSVSSAQVSLTQFLQTFSGYGEMGSQGVEAYGAFWQRPQRMFGSARIVPPPFSPPLIPVRVLTGRKYRMAKNITYTKTGRKVFVGWKKL